MADGLNTEPAVGDGPDIGTHEDLGNSWHVPLQKIQFGPSGTFNTVDHGVPLPSSSLPRHSQVIGSTGTVYSVEKVSVDINTLGDNTILTPGSGNKIIILGGVLMAGADVDIRFKSAATNLSGAMPVASRGGFKMELDAMGHLETADDEAFIINLSAAEQLSGFLQYIEV